MYFVLAETIFKRHTHLHLTNRFKLFKFAETLLKVYSPLGHSRCRGSCFFIILHQILRNLASHHLLTCEIRTQSADLKTNEQTITNMYICLDYFDVFISCLDSFWRHPFIAEDPLVSKSVLKKNQSHLGWPESEYIVKKTLLVMFLVATWCLWSWSKIILQASLKAILEYPQSSCHSNSIYKPSNVWLWHLAVVLPTGLHTATQERTHGTC